MIIVIMVIFCNNGQSDFRILLKARHASVCNNPYISNYLWGHRTTWSLQRELNPRLSDFRTKREYATDYFMASSNM